jgi:non-specific serine/threonine protein kinase
LDDPERLLRFDAIRLFVERARDVEPRFGLSRSNAPAVIQVCARLDGIPLAIELAASRVASLGVERISERLDDRFRVLTVGSRTALPRHQTLRASIDWSHDLLSDAERILFRRLAVFAGGFTLEDAEAVCPHPQMDDQIAGAEPERAARRDSATAARLDRADILPFLAGLIDKSLVHVDGRDGDVRYTLLETVRQYARECLREADEIELLSRAHLSWCLGLATRFQVEVNGPLPTDTLRHVDRDLDNLRAALEWCKADATRTEEGLLLAATLGQFWRLTGRIREGCRHLVELLALCSSHPSPRTRAIALTAAGHLTQLGGDFSQGHAYCAEAVALLRPAGPSMELGQAIVQLGVTAYGLGRPDEAALLWNEALLLGQAFGDDEMEAFANHLLGVIAQDRGDLSLAGVHLTEALRVERKRSRDKASIALTTFEMGIVAMIQGDLGRAAEMYHECLKLWREVGYQVGVALVINGMAWIADRRGQPARAARLASAASTVRDRVGVDLFVSHRPLHEKTLERTRASLGEDAWNRAWAEGSAMTADEAIQYAWQTTDAEDSSPDGSAG